MSPVDTAGRLRQLLAILVWLDQVGEAPIDEIAARFDLTPEALVTELELAACCGLPPYTPDQLMEIVVTDTVVSAHHGSALSRPRRLTPSEGFALAASARGLLAVQGSDEDGTLSRALEKLETALGGERLVIDLDTPPMLTMVRDAATAKQRLEITYYSASSDRRSQREIAPLRVFASEGHWYVDALCALAGDVRRFRIDRIDEARVVEGPAASRGDWVTDIESSGFETFVPGPDTRRVRLSLDPGLAWMVESIPVVAPAVEVGGRLELEVVVGGDAWLERLLLRLGPEAVVIDPPEDATLAAEAAARILLRYQK
ncbi:MAG TPA: WYL domain-containing protein [Acidimicrobiales bacterium]|jgi:proteasome accessory factor C|nr:WYL domain-containing protein [Acidimicrobiales bacterium]